MPVTPHGDHKSKVFPSQDRNRQPGAQSSSLGMEIEVGQVHRLSLARAHCRLEPGLAVASLGQSLTVLGMMWRLRPWAGLRGQGKTVLAQDHGKSIVAV